MLKEAIESAVEKIKKYRDYYEKNEMAVRDQIVNPILRSLKWDPENPEEVQPNTTTEEGYPDYALIKDGKTLLFIEVKKLSKQLEKDEVIKQLANYCFSEGAEYGVLTNGAIWLLFKAFKIGTKPLERILLKINIESDEITASMRKLEIISKDNIDNLEQKLDELIKKQQILEENWKIFVEKPDEIANALAPVFEKLIKERYSDYQFEVTELEDFVKEKLKSLFAPQEKIPEPASISSESYRRERKTKRSPPKRINRIKIGGEIFEIENSYEILTNTAEWLIKKGKIKLSDIPIPLGRKRYLINGEPRHRDGTSFRAPRKLSSGIYIETHYSTDNCINNAKKLLKMFGFKEDILEIL